MPSYFWRHDFTTTSLLLFAALFLGTGLAALLVKIVARISSGKRTQLVRSLKLLAAALFAFGLAGAIVTLVCAEQLRTIPGITAADGMRIWSSKAADALVNLMFGVILAAPSLLTSAIARSRSERLIH